MECDVIGQQGTVVAVNDKVKLWVVTTEDCSTCALKGVCPAPKGRVIEVDKPEGMELKPGDKVHLELEEKRGPQALLIMYIVPFFVMITVLVIVRILTGNDGIAGLAAIASLAPYYFIIYLLRKVFEKNFQFKIKPL